MRRLIALVVLGTALGATVHAAPVKQVAVRDASRDVVADGLDITRVSMQIASDGKLRVAVTLRSPVSIDDLAAPDGGGPPGGICVRLWTAGQAPATEQPDHLVCTSVSKRALKVGVFRTRPGDLPVRTASGSSTKASPRTIVLRFAQTAVGHPARLRFGVETTRPGCPRTSCIDTAPNAPGSAELVIRAAAKADDGGAKS